MEKNSFDNETALTGLASSAMRLGQLEDARSIDYLLSAQDADDRQRSDASKPVEPARKFVRSSVHPAPVPICHHTACNLYIKLYL
jgi:hypothetical protein